MRVHQALVIYFAFAAVRAEHPGYTCEQLARFFDGDWECSGTKPLGEGAMAVSYLLHDKKKKEHAVIKAAYAVDDEDVASLKNEQYVLKKIKHKNIIEALGLDRKGKFFFELLEYAEKGTLEHVIGEEREYFEDPINVTEMFQGILEGVAAMHAKGIVHADLKTANIVVMADYTPKIIDFDLVVADGDVASARGSLANLDPRLFDVDEMKFDPKVDVFSLGVVFYNMLHANNFPFDGDNYEEYMANVKAGVFTVDARVDPELADIIRGCLKVDPAERPTVSLLLAATKTYLHSHPREPEKVQTPELKEVIADANTDDEDEEPIVQKRILFQKVVRHPAEAVAPTHPKNVGQWVIIAIASLASLAEFLGALFYFSSHRNGNENSCDGWSAGQFSASAKSSSLVDVEQVGLEVRGH